MLEKDLFWLTEDTVPGMVAKMWVSGHISFLESRESEY